MSHAKSMNKSQLMAQPLIFANGYRSPRYKGPDDVPVVAEQVETCRAFLRKCKRTKTGCCMSCALGSVIGDAMGRYVSNGALLQACGDLGIPSPRITLGDCLFNTGMVAVSWRSVLAAYKHFSILDTRARARKIRADLATYPAGSPMHEWAGEVLNHAVTREWRTLSARLPQLQPPRDATRRVRGGLSNLPVVRRDAAN